MTGLLVDTGISMMEDDFDHAVSIFRFSTLTCPHCAEVHRYDKPNIVFAVAPTDGRDAA
jgi:hypothetical protein